MNRVPSFATFLVIMGVMLLIGVLHWLGVVKVDVLEPQKERRVWRGAEQKR